jgi:uncharacterized membrane protein YhaH (DUF805 family)
MGPFKAIGSCYRNILNFSGRARRAEYWWFTLFLAIAGLAVQVAFLMAAMGFDLEGALRLDAAALKEMTAPAPELAPWALGIAVGSILFAWLPHLAVTVRRLHDTDRSGWFIFMPFVVAVLTMVGVVALGFGGGTAAMPLVLLLSAVPILAYLWFLVVLCLPGTNGRNRFGPDPVTGRKPREADHPAFAARLEPEEQEALAAQRRAEIKAYYRKNVLPGIQKA